MTFPLEKAPQSLVVPCFWGRNTSYQITGGLMMHDVFSETKGATSINVTCSFTAVASQVAVWGWYVLVKYSLTSIVSRHHSQQKVQQKAFFFFSFNFNFNFPTRIGWIDHTNVPEL